MSCNGCAKKFSLFKSERGCPGCGFSFCSSCLEHSIHVEKSNKVAKVCNKCKMSDDAGNVPGPSQIEPPKAYLRRLETLGNPSKPPITVYRSNDRMGRLKKGLSETDVEIAERLEKLREDQNKTIPPTDHEIKERLAKLRDEPVATSSTKCNIPAVDIRTDQEKCDDLLKQYMDECHIDETRTTEFDKAIHERLNVLKGQPLGTENKAMIPENLSDEEMTNRLISQILSQKSDDELSDEICVDKSSDEPMSDDALSSDKSEDEKM